MAGAGLPGAIQSQANELLAANHDVLEFFDRDKLKAATAADGATITNDQRNGIERALDMAEWFDLRKPTLKLD